MENKPITQVEQKLVTNLYLLITGEFYPEELIQAQSKETQSVMQTRESLRFTVMCDLAEFLAERGFIDPEEWVRLMDTEIRIN